MMSVHRMHHLFALSTLGSLALVLSGCAFSGPPAAVQSSPAGGGSTIGSATAHAGLGGKVYGGQQAITGAAVTLWAAGTASSYGSGAVSIATTSTLGDGSFSFNINNGTASPCTTGQYLYITSTGGDASFGTNQYAALMAALPAPCGPTTPSTYVVVNEVTTVASVTALQQFMSIAPGSSPAWNIGAPAANVTGMANAFTQVGNLVNIGTGTSGATTAANTINNGTANVTYTTTITPDFNKIDAAADILAACINTSGSSRCTNLFTDTTPSGSTAPTDTIQVAYYMATNPAGLNMPAHGDPGSPSYLCSQYIDSLAPFPLLPSQICNVNTTGTYPTDWAIGVSWSTSNGTAVVGTATPYSIAIDGLGNIWTAYGCSSSTGCTDTLNDHNTGPAYVTEFNPQGQVQFTPATGTTISTGPSFSTYTGSTAYSLIASRPFSLAIDTANNTWFDTFYGAAPATQRGVITKFAQGGASTGYLVAASSDGAISIDGNNNIFLIGEPTASRYSMSELEYDSGAYSTFNAGLGKATAIYNSVWTDPFGYGWSANSTCANPETIQRGSTADMETAATTDNVTNETVCPNYSGAADSAGGAFFANGSLYHVAISGGGASKSAPVTVTEAAGTGPTNGGLDGGAGVAVDGLGNVWVANNSGGGVSEFTYNGSAFTPLSPAGTSIYGFGTSYLSGTKPINVAADASGNVWVGTQTTNLWYLVGIAGPTVTPVATMLKNNYVGSRPGSQMLVTLSPALTYSTLIPATEPLTATLTNVGNASVDISQVSITGTNQSDFTVTGNTCGATLAIGANCAITVTFSSGTAGTFSAALNVASNAAGSPASVALTGTAISSVTLGLDAGTTTSPMVPSITFASMAASKPSLPQVIVVQNTGSVPLTLALGMSGSSFFSQSSTCGSSVAVGASCNITLTFWPRVAGSYSGTLTLTDNAGSNSQSIPLSGTATPFAITINTTNAGDWKIDNGAVSIDWSSTGGNIFGLTMDGYTDQLTDTTTSQGFYMDNAGLGSGTPTSTYTLGPGGSYLDWSITTPSNASNAYTYSEHFVMYPNDPGWHVYFVANHATTDIAGAIGQIQWVFRDSLTQFTNTYEVNPSVNSPGVTQWTLPANNEMFSGDPGRTVQDATTDLHGFTDLPSGWTRGFYTKYDHAGYEYLHQAHGLFGSTYGVWTVLPKLETLSGGPTKQDLYFTGNLNMIEAYSNHEDNNLTLNTAAGTASSRLFGPFYVHLNTFGPAYNSTGNVLQTADDMYADALSSEAAFVPQYDNEAQLTAAGYVASTGRGSVTIQMNGVTGAARTAWAVLSDQNKNFEYSSQGMQYWADISSTGSATFTGVAPGTYRLSVYVLGQWGEYRQDGIVVTANNTTAVPVATFVPEDFGTTVFTIGIPDRSAHEFLHGHTSDGKDDREFWGAWNYWADFAANNGAVIYNGTDGPAGSATNDLTKWNYVHWGTSFSPGLFAGVFNSSDDTTDGYFAYPGQTYPAVGAVAAESAIPTYVAGLPGASGTNGAGTGIPAWQVHFATPANFMSEAYVVLSVAVACDEGSYVVALNGNSYTWSRTNQSDCMVRSGLSGYTQWFVMQWPTSALTQSAGADNVITIGMSQVDGASDDALRLELTNTSAAPATTGWNDYTFLSPSPTVFNNDAVGNP